MGVAIFVTVGGSGVLAFIAWWLTTYRHPASEQIVSVYLFTVGCLHIHILEEYLAGFAPAMSRLFQMPAFTESLFLISFAFVGISLWILAAIGLIYQNPLANYVAWFMFIGPGFMEITHYIFPLLEGGSYHYFPGMWTAWLPMLPGLYGMFLISLGRFPAACCVK